jgi:hypothetical protein
MMQTKYPYIRAWGAMMGSFPHYIDSQIERATRNNAPWNATFVQGPSWAEQTWSTIVECENYDTRKFCETYVARNYPDVIESPEYQAYVEEAAKGELGKLIDFPSKRQPAEPVFTDKTKVAIIQVASDCVPDMEYRDRSNAEIVAEVALDANRLTIFGHKEADEEVEKLVEKFGYGAVLKAAAKIVPTD